MLKPWSARVTGALPGDPPLFGSPSCKRFYAIMGYRDRTRTKIGVFADNRRHAVSVAKKAGYETLMINELKDA